MKLQLRRYEKTTPQRICFLRAVVAQAVLLISIAQFGCDSTKHLPPNISTRQWTVMVYMSADDSSSGSLEPHAINDLNEMELVGSDENIAIVVQVDRVPSHDVSNDNWTTTRRYLITYDPTYNPHNTKSDRTIRSTLLGDLGEVNMGSPETLINFVKWAKANYPAKHYVLVLWNHGRGVDDASPYRLRTQLLRPRGVIYDDTNEDFLTIPELGYALNKVKPIDIVAFDACLMAMIEIAYEIRNSASLMCASQLSPPDEGYRYDLWLRELKSKPTMSPQELATSIVKKYVESVGSYVEVAESAIKLSEVETLVETVNEFAKALIGVASKFKNELANARDKTSYAQDYPEFKDLYHYAENVRALVNEDSIKALASDVMERLKESVLENRTTGSLNNFNGLSIYLPSPPPRITNIGYANTAFAIDTQWDEWLAKQMQ